MKALKLRQVLNFFFGQDTEIFFKKMIKRLVPRVFNSFMSESNRKEYKKKKQGKSKRKTEWVNRAESLKRRNYRIPAVTNILNIKNVGMMKRVPA